MNSTETKTELPMPCATELMLVIQERNTLRKRLEAVEKELENEVYYGRCKDETATVFMNQVKKLQTELTKLEKANGELVSRIEQALAHLVEAGSNKKHDPSWIRPMTMTRKEVNDACIQAYHQLQTCLDTAEALKGEG